MISLVFCFILYSIYDFVHVKIQSLFFCCLFLFFLIFLSIKNIKLMLMLLLMMMLMKSFPLKPATQSLSKWYKLRPRILQPVFNTTSGKCLLLDCIMFQQKSKLHCANVIKAHNKRRILILSCLRAVITRHRGGTFIGKY